MDQILNTLNLYIENILLIFMGLFLLSCNKYFGSITAKSQMSVNKSLGINTSESLEREYGSKLVKIIGIGFIGYSLFQIIKKAWA